MAEELERYTQESPSAKDAEDCDKQDDDSLDTPIDCWSSKDACRTCCCSVNNYWRSATWLGIILAYLFLGGLFFSLAERPAELDRAEEAVAAQAQLEVELNALVQAVVNNSNFTENETIALLQGFRNASDRLNEALAQTEVVQVWDFASAVFFCVTVITTIGYGTIAPSTGPGQTLFIFYALIGIPLALTFLATIGTIMTDYLEAALNPILKKTKEKRNPVVVRGIGILVFLLLALVFMIFIPSAIFYAIEDWTYGESIYYCFVTLTTVGFGDFVPSVAGSIVNSANSALVGLYKLIVAVWLWIGLAFVAAIITELTNFIDAITKRLHKSRCCSRGESADIENQELATKVSPPPSDVATPTDKEPPAEIAESADDDDH